VVLAMTSKGKSLLNAIAQRSLGELGAQGPQMISSLTTLLSGQ